MKIPFSLAREYAIDEILGVIGRYLGEAGKRYISDIRIPDGVNPFRVDLAGYGYTDGSEEIGLRRMHDIIVQSHSAEDIDEIDLGEWKKYKVQEKVLLAMETSLSEEDILGFFRDYAEKGVEDAIYISGVLTFIGFGCISNSELAREYFSYICPVETDSDVGAWVEFFNEPPIGEDEATDPQAYLSTKRESAGRYGCPLNFFTPEWFVLQSLVGRMPQDLAYSETGHIHESNDLFELHPYDEDNLDPDADCPNFSFRPFGLEITWYKDQKSMVMNLPLTMVELRYVLRQCIRYIIENKTWRLRK